MNKYYLIKPDGFKNLARIVYFICGITCIIAGIVITNSLWSTNSYNDSRKAAKRLMENKISQTRDSGYTHSTVTTNVNNIRDIIKDYYEKREGVELSKLGEILFLNAPLPKRRNKTFNILVWKDGPFLERRHLRYFSNEKHDPFAECSVNNCILTYEAGNLTTADGVIFLLHRLPDMNSIPDPLAPRPVNQRWIFLTDESPFNTFLYKHQSWENYSGIFNWSMSYKMESDIPVPYGRTVPLINGNTLQDPDLNEKINGLIPYNTEKRRDVLVAILTSNCVTHNPRMEYVHELQKYIDVDIYGSCGDHLKTACPGHFGADCPKLNSYLFYLSFENSNCDQYITEKLFWNAYSKGSVPVIMGPLPNVCDLLLPPNSYIHTHDYARPADLARYILFLNDTWNEHFFDLHKWRMHFEARNEHGYFGTRSYHYCRVCEALNYNDESESIYDELSFFLSPDDNCRYDKKINTAE